jgi:hypothetical protein
MARNHGHDYSTSLPTLHIINTYNPLKYGFDSKQYIILRDALNRKIREYW